MKGTRFPSESRGRLHGKQLAGIPHGVDAEHEDVEEREDHRDQPQAERDRRHDREGRQRSAPERAERIEDVAHAIVHECGAARIATLVGGQGHGAEARARPGASLGRAQAVCEVLLGLAFEVER